MRARNIKPGFFKNERLADLDYASRLLFAGLWCLADCEGRLEDRPKRIRAELFPYDEVDAEPLLRDLVSAEFITRYSIDGRNYIQVNNFRKHQKPHGKEVASGSVIPGPGPEKSEPSPNFSEPSPKQIRPARPDSTLLIPDSPLLIPEENLCPPSGGRVELSVDQPPFETTEQDSLFPLTPPVPDAWDWPGVSKATQEQVDAILEIKDIPVSTDLDSRFMIQLRLRRFEDVWGAFKEWKRGKASKKKARVLYFSIVKTAELHEQILVALWAQTEEMLKRKEMYRPHLSTWLKDEGWISEMPESDYGDDNDAD